MGGKKTSGHYSAPAIHGHACRLQGFNEPVSSIETGEINHETVTNAALFYAFVDFIYLADFDQFNVEAAHAEPRSSEKYRAPATGLTGAAETGYNSRLSR